MGDLFATIVSTLGGGLMGSVIKIIVGLLAAQQEDKKHEREILARYAQANRPSPADSFVSRTRRVLALSVTWTFCGIAVLWAIWPAQYIDVPTGVAAGESASWRFLSLGEFSLVEIPVADPTIQFTTGAIVWGMLPFFAMVLSTYFTPDIRKL